MEEPLCKEYKYPPGPTCHGLPDEDCEFGDVDDPGAYGPFEIGK